MTAHDLPKPADVSPASVGTTSGIERVITADASKVTAAQFAEHFFGPYEDKRQVHIENTIRKIKTGADLYGVPPMMVEHCRKIIAERRLAPRSELNPNHSGIWLA